MKNLKDPLWIKLKSVLFLILGLLASSLIVMEQPTVRTTTLLLLVIWSFCRFYYFCFYVVETYVDSNYQYSGLMSLLRYFVTKKS